MPEIIHEIYVDAPIEVCFDLTRDVDVHTATTATTKERAVGGVTSGLMEEGDAVTWEAVHFGVKQRLTARITEMERPYYFKDELVKGAFKWFVHTHEFEEQGSGTLMRDCFVYASPFGFIGKLADWLFLERYMRKFLTERANALKQLAEEEASKQSLENRKAIRQE